MQNPKSEEKTQKRGLHSSPSKKAGILRVGTIIITLIALACITLVAVANGYTNVVYPNTYLGGLPISGMNESELTEVTASFSESKIKGAIIPLSCNGNTAELSVDDLNIKYDQLQTKKIALSSGKGQNIFANTISFVKRWFVPENIEPFFVYNTDVMASAIDSVANGCETEPVGHTFEIGEDSVTIFAPTIGVKINREAATSAILGRVYVYDFSPLTLIPTETHPGELNFDKFYKWLTSESENAYYEKTDGKIAVINSKPQCKVDKQAARDAIDSLKNSEELYITIPAVVTQPERTAKVLTERLYKDVLGSYTTYFGTSTAARANNVRLAASRVNGTELMPGEEFSYDKTILRRTSANGYMTAGVYVGNKVESGMGGGICQPSSTLYAAALYANLEILERHNHSLTVSYLPPGLDATIAEGYLDLRLKNNTNYPVKISAITEGGSLTFKILGYNENNTSVDILRSFSNGKYYVTRVVKENGVEIKREAMTSSAYGVPEEDEEQEPEDEEKKEGEEGETPPEDEETETPNGEGTPPENASENDLAPEPEPAPAPTPVPTPAPDTTQAPTLSE